MKQLVTFLFFFNTQLIFCQPVDYDPSRYLDGGALAESVAVSLTKDTKPAVALKKSAQTERLLARLYAGVLVGDHSKDQW
jgi:hypothetical protein